ncbi:MAG: response regulator [Anaerolineales bacterium]|jgi:DNA-binding response OmpR family regulator
MDQGIKKIVIVEDDPETAKMFAEMVRLLGYHEQIATSGTEAIGMIAREKPKAVILDWILPDISGIEVMQKLNKDAQLAKIPIIMITAKTHPNEVNEGIRMGASAYLTKPVDFRDLENALNTLIIS